MKVINCGAAGHVRWGVKTLTLAIRAVHTDFAPGDKISNYEPYLDPKSISGAWPVTGRNVGISHVEYK